jgi:hypothetical protein
MKILTMKIPNGEEEDEFHDEETFFQTVQDGKTFSEALSDDIDLITEFLAGVISRCSSETKGSSTCWRRRVLVSFVWQSHAWGKRRG